MNKRPKVLVLGLGVSGRSAVRFCQARGSDVWGVDKSLDIIKTHPEIKDLCRHGLQAFHESESIDLSEVDQVILSPGIPSTHPLCQKAQAKGIEIIGEVELACRHIKQPMVGITGTNGKTTVTLLVAHVLNACGKKAKALGNVGVPLTEELLDKDQSDVIVTELSSYQLETLSSQVLDAAVILNVTPDHLDRYVTMENYAVAKIQIHQCLKPGFPLFIHEHMVKDFSGQLQGIPYKTFGYESNSDIWTDLKQVFAKSGNSFSLPSSLQGRRSHDIENFMAAFAICQSLGVSSEEFLKGFASFVKPHHRIEFVKNINGVNFYDDSKGTNIDAVIRAVESLEGPIVLIAGGVDKGFPYTPWIKAFADKVKCIYTIGQSAAKIEEQLKSAFSVTQCKNLEEAVQKAAKYAKTGDTVLLSPGCSSFDMFRDYAHRGQEFQRLVNNLMSQEASHE